jgi:membrane-associated phospholipid phosphatase
VWILSRCDIQTSAFPSGHVTVGFSAAFAMLLALPEYRRAGWLLLGMASMVLVNTIYGRYHYAADGLAGLAISAAAAGIAMAYNARMARRHV